MPSQMSVLKAFGLNGFLTLFYQKYWRITINVVRICSHKSQCNAGVSKKQKDPELASVVEASHFDARWSGIQKKYIDDNFLCVQIQIGQ